MVEKHLITIYFLNCTFALTKISSEIGPFWKRSHYVLQFKKYKEYIKKLLKHDVEEFKKNSLISVEFNVFINTNLNIFNAVYKTSLKYLKRTKRHSVAIILYEFV